MSFHLMQFVTDFGDTAVLAPIALVIFAWLVAAGAWRSAIAWLIAFGGATAAITLLKFSLKLCGNHLVGGPASPSGHVAISMTVYGALALMLARRLGRPVTDRAIAALFAIAVASIAVSRIAIGAHTLAEVVVGLVVGAAALSFLRAAYRPPVDPPSLRWVAIPVLALLVGLHGSHAAAEEFLSHLVRSFQWHTGYCR